MTTAAILCAVALSGASCVILGIDFESARRGWYADLFGLFLVLAAAALAAMFTAVVLVNVGEISR